MSHKKNILRIVLALLLLSSGIAAYVFNITDYLNLKFLRDQKEIFEIYQTHAPADLVNLFFMSYIIITALSLPGAAVMTLLGGALFGFWKGLILVSFASTFGATLAFLMARFLLRDWIQNRYQKQLSTLNEGFEKEGVFYLFALRLIPLFPFFLVNILTSVMPIKTRQFYIASQIGMLPGTAVYVYAGTELAKIESPSDILSPSIIFAFALLGLLPITMKKIIGILRHRRET